MEVHPTEILFSLLLSLLCYCCPVLSGTDFKMVTMDSYQVCQELKVEVYWASKDKAVVVVGRGADDRKMYRDCSIVIGAAAAGPSILQLNFEAFHIKDCGVALSVNQSSMSDFTAGNTVLAKIGCNHGNMRVLHSLEKHFVKISVHKDNLRLQRYNFRINVTVIDKKPETVSSVAAERLNSTDWQVTGLEFEAVTGSPVTVVTQHMDTLVNISLDKLPETGPETHVVVIVGVVVLVVVGMALYLLVKYLMRRAQRWHERCAERNMERAIRLFNSQESPPESDYMYTALPPRPGDGQRTAAATTQAAHNKGSGNRSGRYRAGDITFVHADGHIESFRMHDSPQERRLAEPEPAAMATTPRSTRSAASVRDRDADSIQENGESASGECPPSYEEALHMPTPQDPRSQLYVNIDDKTDDSGKT